MASELADVLRERIAEDEAIACEAMAESARQWHHAARVLAECAAWRRVIDAVDGWTERDDSDPGITALELFSFLAENLGEHSTHPGQWPPPSAP